MAQSILPVRTYLPRLDTVACIYNCLPALGTVIDLCLHTDVCTLCSVHYQDLPHLHRTANRQLGSLALPIHRCLPIIHTAACPGHSCLPLHTAVSTWHLFAFICYLQCSSVLNHFLYCYCLARHLFTATSENILLLLRLGTLGSTTSVLGDNYLCRELK